MIGKEVVGELLDGLITCVSVEDETAICDEVAGWLKDKGYHVAENEQELMDLALDCTRLVDPSE
jgi:hypothetical protein